VFSAGQQLLGAGAFLDLQASRSTLRSRPSLRLSARAAGTSGGAGETELRILSGRLDLCPLAFGVGPLEARTCAGLELGQIAAERDARGGGRDTAFWSALIAGARLLWPASTAWALELELGVAAPLTRYEFVTGAAESAGSTGSFAVMTGLSGSFRLD
jgi:hypothetical protein